MRLLTGDHPFHRHEMVDLGSITLASFRRRANAFGLDCAVLFAPYIAMLADRVEQAFAAV